MDFGKNSPSVDSSALPIRKIRNEILNLIENNSVVIVVGPTGSGKTTQIPQFLLEQGWTGIACTQPRRLSAMAVASRVSQELGLCGENAGIVGYSVRFEDSTSEKTQCKFITDGMLFRECLHDPLLSKYSVIMIDEAHERTLHTDLLLAMIKKILLRRPELRIIISSATIDAEAFKRYFTFPRRDFLTGKKIYGPLLKPPESHYSESHDPKTSPTDSRCISSIKDFIPIDRFEPKIISIEGRTFPVEIEFLLHGPTDRMVQNEDIIVDSVVRLIQQINENESGPGDILVFLSGRTEIEKCFDMLTNLAFHKRQQNDSEDVTELMNLFKKNKRSKMSSSTPKATYSLDLLQLYAGMNSTDQLKVFDPSRPGSRKVILSTNIAEASITIDGIVYVIDTGRVKIRVFDGGEGEKMVTIPVSRASADQRSGRAGRTRPGKAFRLYTREFFESPEMPKHSIPDLQLTKLTSVILQLKAMRITDVLDFDFLSPLPSKNVHFALEELKRLGAINSVTDALIDPFGKQMAQLPLEPELGHFFLKASNDCPREAAALAAMLTIQNNQNNNTKDQFFLSDEKYSKFQRRFWVEEGDHMTLLSVFMSYSAHLQCSVKFCQKFGLNLKNLNLAHRLFTNLLAYLKKVFKKPTDRTVKMSIENISINLRKSLISAFPMNISKSDESLACYVSVPGSSSNSKQLQFIHPNSVLFRRLPPLILYGNQIETTKKFLNFVTIIEPDWLEEIHPNLYKQIRK